jgi:hypothetical protein
MVGEGWFEDVARKRANGSWASIGEPKCRIISNYATIDEAIIVDSVNKHGGV